MGKVGKNFTEDDIKRFAEQMKKFFGWGGQDYAF